MSRRLPNYLRTFRKRSGLSQREISYLLGGGNASKVSRYEQSSRLPNLRTEMAFEAVFQSTAGELFAGMFEDITRSVRRRAAALIKRLAARRLDAVTGRKLQTLRAILGDKAADSQS